MPAANLQSALYAYTLTLDVDEDDDDEGGLNPYITSIALHRIVAVCVGAIWGMFITTYIWPISARYNMRVGLSELYLHLGWFFRTAKDDDDFDKPANGNLEAGEGASVIKIRPFMSRKQELALQAFLIHLKGLLGAAANEPRLKGPFPVSEYKTLLSNGQDILDTLSHFRVMLAEEIQSQSDTKALLPRIQANINEICDRIFLSFYRTSFLPLISLSSFQSLLRPYDCDSQFQPVFQFRERHENGSPLRYHKYGRRPSRGGICQMRSLLCVMLIVWSFGGE